MSAQTMRAVVSMLVIDSAVASAQGAPRGSAHEERKVTTPTGFGMPQPVPGYSPPKGERKEPGPPALTAQRYVEDYSYLRDPDERTGAWWEPLKYIPLSASEWAYLTVGDELRLRGEYYRNNDFDTSPLQNDGPYLLYYQAPYADVHFGDHVRVFAQLLVAYATRSELTKTPLSDQTGFEIGQAIVEWRTSLGDAGELAVRGGRQILVYGSGRFINNGPNNVPRRFDGGVVQWDIGHWRLDLFLVKPALPRFPSFDDLPDPDITVWSAYATHMFRDHPRLGLDLYYLGYVNDEMTLEAGTGREVRHTLGTRFFGYEKGLFWDVEPALQLGSFAGDALRAWGVSAQSRYTLWGVPLKPWSGLRVAATSGDENPRDDTVETFNPLFARGSYYGENGVIGPLNMVNLEPGIGAALGPGLEASVTVTWFWRQSTGDGVYDLDGELLRPASGSDARFIGTEPEVNLSWQIDRNVNLYGVYSMIVPGRFIKESGPANTVYYAAAQMQWRY